MLAGMRLGMDGAAGKKKRRLTANLANQRHVDRVGQDGLVECGGYKVDRLAARLLRKRQADGVEGLKLARDKVACGARQLRAELSLEQVHNVRAVALQMVRPGLLGENLVRSDGEGVQMWERWGG